jgi:Reverse transcriptase (RNA-dependent DNA polymerase).
LCKHLSDIFIPNNSILFSFDVNNLFTNIPHSECINILNSHLHNSDVPDHIAEYLLSLTKLALEQDFFRFNNRFYKQSDGLAMGSPLSPFLSELFMSSFEEQLNLSPFFNNNIIIWRRYVDDIFGIFHGSLDDLKLFHSWLNSRHPKIKFSIELGKKDTLPFLDLLISIDNNKASFNIYRKPTTTDLLIPYNSTAPLSHKLASFRFLFNRLHSVPMSNTNFTSELNTIFYLAKVNNYPYVTINNLHQKIRIKHLTPNTTLSRTTSSHLFFSLPFLPHISQKVASVITNQCPQIKISFTTSHLKLKSVFSKLKDPIDPLSDHGIYKLNCTCGSFYIGRTIRNFNIRAKEHISQALNHLKRGSHINSAFSNHIIDTGHISTLDSSQFKPDILHKGGKVSFLNSMEIFHILRSKHNQENIVNNTTDFKSNLFLSLVVGNLN